MTARFLNSLVGRVMVVYAESKVHFDMVPPKNSFGVLEAYTIRFHDLINSGRGELKKQRTVQRII